MYLNNKLDLLSPLWEKLDNWDKYPTQREKIEEEIWNKWGEYKAIMFTDLSGFSRLTRKYGIIYYLSLIRTSHRLYLPIIKKYKGKVINIIGDDLVVHFPKAENAIDAAIEMQKETYTYNCKKISEDEKLKLAIGIEYGKILLIEDIEFFGDPVNIASKLGEDIAESGDILIGEGAFNSLSEHNYKLEKEERKISGIELIYYKVIWNQ